MKAMSKGVKMARIERRKAIKLLWSKANESGMSSDFIHDILKEWVANRLVASGRISCMENADLSFTLENLFRVKMFVYDEPMIKLIRKLIYSTRGLDSKVEGILKRWKKESIYQTTPKQKQFLVSYCLKEHHNEIGDTPQTPPQINKKRESL